MRRRRCYHPITTTPPQWLIFCTQGCCCTASIAAFVYSFVEMAVGMLLTLFSSLLACVANKFAVYWFVTVASFTGTASVFGRLPGPPLPCVFQLVVWGPVCILA